MSALLKANHHPSAVAARVSRLEFERAHDAHEAAEVDFGLQRTRALIGIGEICRVAEHRLKSGNPLNWHKAAYCWAVCALMFPGGGRYRQKQGKHWRQYQREYFATWPHATAEAMLKQIAGAPRDAWVIEAVQSGIDRARRRRAKGFVNSDTAAKMLGVDRAEREALKLLTIGATDFLKAERQAEAKAKRLERDRTRQATARAAAGARPRSESYSAVRPWEAFGESRASFYRRSKEEREQMRKHVIGDRETNSSPPISATQIYRPGDAPVSAKPDEPSRVVPFPKGKSAEKPRQTALDFWHECFDGHPLAEPPKPPPSAPDARDGRRRWWEEPVEGWPREISFRNFVTDRTTRIRLGRRRPSRPTEDRF